jgi:hypothetical protein
LIIAGLWKWRFWSNVKNRQDACSTKSEEGRVYEIVSFRQLWLMEPAPTSIMYVMIYGWVGQIFGIGAGTQWMKIGLWW